MAERRRGLGRGLGALIPSAVPEDELNSGVNSSEDQKNTSGVSRETPLAEPEAKGTETPTKSEVAKKSARKAKSSPTSEASSHAPKAAQSKSFETEKRKAQTKKTSDKTQPEEEEANFATENVSRETPKTKKRSVSAEERQKTMKARLDMGVSARSTATNRPSDMFFTPTPSQGMEALSDNSDTEHSHDGENSYAVSRETDDVKNEQISTSNDEKVRQNVSHDQNDKNLENSDVGSDSTDDTEGLQIVPGATFVELPVNNIHPNRKQPRQVFDEDELEELAYSIKELGVLQPVVVRVSRETGGPEYELVMGERRWRATQRAGLDYIPAIIRETSDNDLLRDALLENLHRSQLNPLEEAAAYQQLMEEFGASQEELSRRIGRSRPQISNTLRLLRLPALVQRRVAAGVLSAGHARALLSLEDPAEMERLAQRIVAEGLSVRATEETVTLNKRRKPAIRRSATLQERHRERLDYIADAFSDKLDTSVKINLGARKGRMTIEFASVEDLNRIISVLDPENLPENQD